MKDVYRKRPHLVSRYGEAGPAHIVLSVNVGAHFDELLGDI